MSPFDQTRPPPAGEDDLIELTEVVEEVPLELADEGTAEVVLDFSGGSDDLASLKAPAETREEQPSAPPGETLDDFLASLPELPEDLDVPPETPPLKPPAATDLHQELAQRLSDAELAELVRQVVQETVERLARELLPKMASEAIERELQLWKKRLTEPD